MDFRVESVTGLSLITIQPISHLKLPESLARTGSVRAAGAVLRHCFSSAEKNSAAGGLAAGG
jgi:hypothetical protein